MTEIRSCHSQHKAHFLYMSQMSTNRVDGVSVCVFWKLNIIKIVTFYEHFKQKPHTQHFSKSQIFGWY